MASHEVTQKGRPRDTPEGQVRHTPVVQPVPAEEPAARQERWCRPAGAMAEAGKGGGARGQAASQSVGSVPDTDTRVCVCGCVSAGGGSSDYVRYVLMRKVPWL